MRILQLHTRYRQPGGEDAVVRAERSALERAGHEVRHYIECNPEGALPATAAVAGSVWNPAAARRVARAVEETRPDVAHVHNTWFAMSPSVLAALRRRRVPVVATVHNYRLACVNALFLRDGAPCEACLEHGVWHAVRHRCYRDSRVLSGVSAAGIAVHRSTGTWARYVDRFLVLSEFARERLIRAGLPSQRLELGSNFVEDPGPRPTPPSHSRDVLFVGRISPEKGLGLLLRAWGNVAPPGLRLVVVGDGPELAPLRRAAPPDVTFVGRVPTREVTRRMRSARALVIPSMWYEGQPVSALEGLACGTPLVLSDIGGLPEVLGGSRAGWTSPPNRPDELGHTLGRLVDDRAVDDRGSQARRRYDEAFTPTAAVARLEAAYAAVRTPVAS